MSQLGGFQFEQLGADWQEDEKGEKCTENNSAVKQEIRCEENNDFGNSKFKGETQIYITSTLLPVDVVKKKETIKISPQKIKKTNISISSDKDGKYFCNSKNCTYDWV